MKRKALVLAGGFLCLAASSVLADVLIIDDFESYKSDQVLATSSTSFPWERFGLVDDNLYVATGDGEALTGNQSAKIAVAIVKSKGSASIHKHFEKPTDFTAFTSATVMVKSLAPTASTAAIQLCIQSGKNDYLTTAPVPISITAQTVTFSLAASAFIQADGNETFDKVLHSVTSMGFRITSTAEDPATSETIDFDDFVLHNDAPAK